MFRKQDEIGKEIVEKVRSAEIKVLSEQLSEWNKLFVVSNLSKYEIQLLTQQFSEWKEKEPLGLSNLISPWVSFSNIKSPFPEVVYDLIYGCVRLEPEIASLYHHPIVERLNHIRQLSFAFTFPSATHSRLSHSLGVVYLMEEALTKIFNKNKIYSNTEESPIFLSKKEEATIILNAKAVSLLHDIGYGPFSHTIDRYIGFHKNIPDYPDKTFSYEFLQKYLKNAIEECGLDFKAISDILDRNKDTKGGFNQLIINILDSSLDVDRMDYLVRDAHFSGLPVGEINAIRLIEYMSPFVSEDDTITLSYLEDAIPYIRHFLYARSSMYTNCYEHSTKLAAERMVGKAVDDLIENEFKEKIDLDHLKLLVDDQLLNFILVNSKPTAGCFKLTKALLAGEVFEELYKIDISKFVTAEKKPRGVAKFLEYFQLRNRKRTYIEQVRTQEKIFAEECGLNTNEFWKVAIYLPPPEAMFSSEIGIPILRRKNNGFEIVEIGKASPDVQDLCNLIRNERLKIRVFASPTLPQDDKEKIKEISKERYGSFYTAI